MRAASIAYIASAGDGKEKNSENLFRYIHTISEERRSELRERNARLTRLVVRASVVVLVSQLYRAWAGD